MVGNETVGGRNFKMDGGNYLLVPFLDTGFFLPLFFFFLGVAFLCLLFGEALAVAPALVFVFLVVDFVNFLAFIFVEAPRVGVGTLWPFNK